MKLSVFIVVWLGVPLIGILLEYCKLWSLSRRIKHDEILFKFCRVRDAFALKVLKQELSEDSELFDFFYYKNATLIHNNRKLGVCFKEMAHGLANMWDHQSQPVSVEKKRFLRELKNADDSTKELAFNFITAVVQVLRENSASVFLRIYLGHWQRNLSLFARWMTTPFVIPSLDLQAMRVTEEMRQAVIHPSSQNSFSSRASHQPLGA